MIDRIKHYVDYIFKMNDITDNNMKAEITANLIERYVDLTKEGLGEEEAYLETIKHIGELNVKDVDLESKFSYKPNWANIALWISLGLGILATIVLLLSTSMSILFTGVSIGLHIGASYYLYTYSQYALKQERDVIKHNLLLRSIFANLKIVVISWNINISYWITSTLFKYIVPVLFYKKIDIENLDTESLIQFIISGIIIFLVIFIIFNFIFAHVYKKLERKYEELTKEQL